MRLKSQQRIKKTDEGQEAWRRQTMPSLERNFLSCLRQDAFSVADIQKKLDVEWTALNQAIGYLAARGWILVESLDGGPDSEFDDAPLEPSRSENVSRTPSSDALEAVLARRQQQRKKEIEREPESKAPKQETPGSNRVSISALEPKETPEDPKLPVSFDEEIEVSKEPVNVESTPEQQQRLREAMGLA